MIKEVDVVRLTEDAERKIGSLADQLVFPCMVVNVYTDTNGDAIAQCLMRYKHDTNKIYHLRNWNVEHLESIK